MSYNLVNTQVKDITNQQQCGVLSDAAIIQALKHLEFIGRVCYDSVDKITEDSYKSFITQLINRGHTSVLEHWRFTITVTQQENEIPSDTHDKLLSELEFYLGAHYHQYCMIEDDLVYEQPAETGLDAYDPDEVFKSTLVWTTNLRALIDIIENGFYEESYNDGEITFGGSGCAGGNPNPSEVSTFSYVHFLAHRVCATIFKAGGLDLNLPRLDTYSESDISYYYSSDLRPHQIHPVHSGYRTFLIHTNRAVSHELVRHRHLSFTQQSQRYVNAVDKFNVLDTPSIYWKDDEEKIKETKMVIFKNLVEKARQSYEMLCDLGCPSQEARDVLPNAMETIIIVTGTDEQWKAFLALRDNKATVYPPMYEVATRIREIYDEYATRCG